MFCLLLFSNMGKICRSCMVENLEMNNLFTSFHLIDMYFDCTSIKILENDGLPPYLCEDCNEKLKISYNFKKQSLQTDKLLKSCLKNAICNNLTAENIKCDEDINEYKSVDKIPDELNEVFTEPGAIFNSSNELSENRGSKEDKLKNSLEIEAENLSNISSTLEQKFQCSVCPKKFVKKGFYLKHINIHKKVLNRKNKIESTEIQHDENKIELLKENEDLTVSCHEIDKDLIDDNLFLDGNNKMQCPACDRSFVKQGSFTKHLWTHKNLGLKLPALEKVLRKKGTKSQQKRRHFCKECGKSFSRKDFLSFHKQSAHSKGKPVTKRHLCVYCGKSFDYASNFLIHVRRHTGDLPYKCKECKKAFPRFHDLKCHERQHSGEKPYLCSFCGKSFGLQYKLTRHLRVHTGEKPYKCEICMCSFAQSNDLVNHSKRTHSYACGGCPARFVMRLSLKKHAESSGHQLDIRFKNQESIRKKEITETDSK